MPSMQSQQSGYRSSSSLTPTTIAGVIIIHAALGTAILSMTAIGAIREKVDILWTRNIPAPTSPKADPVKPEQEPVKQPTHVTTTRSEIDLTPAHETFFAKPVDIRLPDNPTGGDIGSLPGFDKPVDPPPAPVLVQAKPDPRFAGVFQPAYPAAMLRLQIEGNVTVHVAIGADGRVTEVTLVSAVDPAFFEATRRQALTRWRFVPATRDGIAVPSERTMTVRFNLTD